MPKIGTIQGWSNGRIRRQAKRAMKKGLLGVASEFDRASFATGKNSTVLQEYGHAYFDDMAKKMADVLMNQAIDDLMSNHIKPSLTTDEVIELAAAKSAEKK